MPCRGEVGSLTPDMTPTDDSKVAAGALRDRFNSSPVRIQIWDMVAFAQGKVELAATFSKTAARKGMGVRIPLSAPKPSYSDRSDISMVDPRRRPRWRVADSSVDSSLYSAGPAERGRTAMHRAAEFVDSCEPDGGPASRARPHTSSSHGRRVMCRFAGPRPR